MKSQWLIQGTGGQSIIDEGGSKRCQLTAQKWMLWNERNNLLNVEIIGLIKVGSNGNYNGGFLLRCDSSSNNAYNLRVSANGSVKIYSLYRVVAGVWTLLATSNSSEMYSVYTKVRFRADGNQISVEEYVSGAWNLIQLVTDGFVITAGYAGINGNSTTGYSVQFDNIEINEKA